MVITLAVLMMLSVFAMTASAAPETSVTGDTDQDEYEPGDTVTITYTVTNTGDSAFGGSVEITDVPNGLTLEDDDKKFFDGNEPPASGQSATMDFTFSVDSNAETGDLNVGAEAELQDSNFESDKDVTVSTVSVDADEAAALEVSNVQPDGTTVELGNSIDVTATVTNTGGEPDSQFIRFSFNDEETIRSTFVELADGESTTVTFEDIDTSVFGTGDHTLRVTSDDDEAVGSVSVEEEIPASFQVSNIQPDGDTVAIGDSIDVTATVTNTGGEQGTQFIRYEVDSIGTLEGESVQLDGDESTTVTFEDINTDTIGTGQYVHRVTSDNDQSIATLTIVSAQDPLTAAADENGMLDRSAITSLIVSRNTQTPLEGTTQIPTQSQITTAIVLANTGQPVSVLDDDN